MAPATTSDRELSRSRPLQDVLYEIRGPVHDHAARLEAEGHRILKLNIGNWRHSVSTPRRDHARHDSGAAVRAGLLGPKAFSARRAVVTRYELVEDFASTSTRCSWVTGL